MHDICNGIFVTGEPSSPFKNQQKYNEEGLSSPGHLRRNQHTPCCLKTNKKMAPPRRLRINQLQGGGVNSFSPFKKKLADII
jgi:hypothetical protein